MKIVRLVLLIMTLCLSSLCAANNPQVYAEPNTVQLDGVIIMLTFPGPPNYESINKGDKAETGPYLLLNHPIDIKDNNEAVIKNVKILQLIIVNQSEWKYIHQGNVVKVMGSLSSPITGHHHAKALLEIKQIKVLSKKKIDSKLYKVE